MIVAVLAATCLALRFWARSPVTPEHDEAISFEAATGHLGEFGRIVDERIAPFGVWATAADWQRLWSVEDRFCFRRIANDLGRRDVHPPLYFWLLHLWLAAFGVSASSGAVLNLALAGITVLLLYALGYYTTKSRPAAAAAVLLWGTSPTSITVTLLTRQYELFALFSVAYVRQALGSSEPERLPRPRELTLLALTAAGGLLTHYHFALVLAAATPVVMWRLWGTSVRRIGDLVVAAGGGAVFALVAHPYLLQAMGATGPRGPMLRTTNLAQRSEKLLTQLAAFGTGVPIVAVLWVSAMVAAAVAMFKLVQRAARAHASPMAREPIVLLVAIVLMLGGMITVLYVGGVSPDHAIQPRHLGPLWPLLALLVTALLWRCRAGRILVAALCVAMLAAAWEKLVALTDAEPFLTVDAGESVLLDSAENGILPLMLWHVAPSTRVFAASQAYLLEHERDWLPAIGERAVYAASITFENSGAGRDRVLSVLRTRYDIVEPPVIPRERWPRQEWFRLRRARNEPLAIELVEPEP
jgi:uncharacterized membrane protein